MNKQQDPKKFKTEFLLLPMYIYMVYRCFPASKSFEMLVKAIITVKVVDRLTYVMAELLEKV